MKNRWKGIDMHRVVDFRKHRKNLLVIEKSIQCTDEDKIILHDALVYIEDYLDVKLHLKTFYIGICSTIRYFDPRRNYLYLKNMLLDIIV